MSRQYARSAAAIALAAVAAEAVTRPSESIPEQVGHFDNSSMSAIARDRLRSIRREFVAMSVPASAGVLFSSLEQPGATVATELALAKRSPTSRLGAYSAIDTLEEQAVTRVAAAVCSKRVVLLGELPEHGEARGFGIKARIVERLATRYGFRAVLFEAGSYDFFGFERAIAAMSPAPSGAAGAERTDSLDLALARAMGGFWWTRELAGWRRAGQPTQPLAPLPPNALEARALAMGRSRSPGQ